MRSSLYYIFLATLVFGTLPQLQASTKDSLPPTKGAEIVVLYKSTPQHPDQFDSEDFILGIFPNLVRIEIPISPISLSVEERETLSFTFFQEWESLLKKDLKSAPLVRFDYKNKKLKIYASRFDVNTIIQHLGDQKYKWMSSEPKKILKGTLSSLPKEFEIFGDIDSQKIYEKGYEAIDQLFLEIINSTTNKLSLFMASAEGAPLDQVSLQDVQNMFFELKDLIWFFRYSFKSQMIANSESQRYEQSSLQSLLTQHLQALESIQDVIPPILTVAAGIKYSTQLKIQETAQKLLATSEELEEQAKVSLLASEGHTLSETTFSRLQNPLPFLNWTQRHSPVQIDNYNHFDLLQLHSQLWLLLLHEIPNEKMLEFSVQQSVHSRLLSFLRFMYTDFVEKNSFSIPQDTVILVSHIIDNPIFDARLKLYAYLIWSEIATDEQRQEVEDLEPLNVNDEAVLSWISSIATKKKHHQVLHSNPTRGGPRTHYDQDLGHLTKVLEPQFYGIQFRLSKALGAKPIIKKFKSNDENIRLLIHPDGTVFIQLQSSKDNTWINQNQIGLVLYEVPEIELSGQFIRLTYPENRFRFMVNYEIKKEFLDKNASLKVTEIYTQVRGVAEPADLEKLNTDNVCPFTPKDNEQ